MTGTTRLIVEVHSYAYLVLLGLTEKIENNFQTFTTYMLFYVVISSIMFIIRLIVEEPFIY